MSKRDLDRMSNTARKVFERKPHVSPVPKGLMLGWCIFESVEVERRGNILMPTAEAAIELGADPDEAKTALTRARCVATSPKYRYGEMWVDTPFGPGDYLVLRAGTQASGNIVDLPPKHFAIMIADVHSWHPGPASESASSTEKPS